jgi:CRISPR/Cas system-associated protein Csx1
MLSSFKLDQIMKGFIYKLNVIPALFQHLPQRVKKICTFIKNFYKGNLKNKYEVLTVPFTSDFNTLEINIKINRLDMNIYVSYIIWS